MITVYARKADSEEGGITELRGLSTDEKPTVSMNGDTILNGCGFLEIDTQKLSFYNAEDADWEEV